MNPQAEALKRRTFRFALDVIRFCRILRSNWEGRELSDQLFRSGTRVGANYRAACRARSDPDFINKIGHVVRGGRRNGLLARLDQAAGVCTDSHLAPLLRESAELSAIFNQSQITAKKNAGRFKKARPPGTRQ